MQNVDGVKLYSVEEIGHLLMQVFKLDEMEILTKLHEVEKYQRTLREQPKNTEPCWDCRLLLPELRNHMIEESLIK